MECESHKAHDKTIDDCYHQVLQRLTDRGKIKEVSSYLVSAISNDDKVIYVYKLLEELQLFPKLVANCKDNQVAVYYRNLGNDCFVHEKNYEAWQYYNLSLLYACTSSEHQAYAISNRSAVFCAMGKYEESLEDIHFVFSSVYPQNIREKLVKRKALCEAELAKAKENLKERNEALDSKINYILDMKSPKDNKYTSASIKLKVVYTKEMGRHVVANADIKAGEVLVQEEPYLSVLLKPQFLFSCAHCLSRKMNLYPCKTCTYALYCSVECRETAYLKYHAVECPLMPSLILYDFTKMEWLALRAVLRSQCDVKNLLTMISVAEEADKSVNTDLWGCVKVGDKWVYDSKYYSSIHTLATNVEKRSVSDIFQKAVTAAVFMHFLSELNYMKCDDPVLKDRYDRYVADTLLRHIMTSPTNMHGICTNIENAEGKFIDECNIGSGAYAFLSLINHSCSPNVVRYSKLGTGKMTLFAIRPIKKGMQIFDNYGYHHAIQDRKTRHGNLSFQYKFICACEACVDDWPTHDNLKPAEGVPAPILKKKDECLAEEVIEKLMLGDKETAVKFFQPLCELIDIFDKFAPCRELAECQEALKQCLFILYGLLPYGYSKLVNWKALPPSASTGGPPHIRR